MTALTDTMLAAKNLSGIPYPREAIFSPFDKTSNDGIDELLEALLKHPCENMVKATTGNDECDPRQFYRDPTVGPNCTC